MALSECPPFLIAGAGWRVWRFVVPALLAAGIPRRMITILRRSIRPEPHSMLQNIRVILTLDEVSSMGIGITLNCVSAASLVEVQEMLVKRFPAAMHFCDTPIFAQTAELARVAYLSRKNLFSLEDWPLMPNMDFFIREVRNTTDPIDLRIYNFGILTHFLSLYRSIHGEWNPAGRLLRKENADIFGHPRRGTLIAFRSKKDLPVAKTMLRTKRRLVEDFHEVEAVPHGNNEVFYRVIDESSVQYYCGSTQISAHKVENSILETFSPFNDRKNVHELDKFIGLKRLFGSLLRGKQALPYGYAKSARDALVSRWLMNGDKCVFI
jgi:hypothetical protein